MRIALRSFMLSYPREMILALHKQPILFIQKLQAMDVDCVVIKFIYSQRRERERDEEKEMRKFITH